MSHRKNRQPPAFRDLEASELFCPRCQIPRPVRERLLLILPDGELHEYRCAICAQSLGTRKLGLQPSAPVALR